MTVGNSLAYYDTATITDVKSFKVQAPGHQNTFKWQVGEMASRRVGELTERPGTSFCASSSPISFLSFMSLFCFCIRID
jgi:hypothetical protein